MQPLSVSLAGFMRQVASDPEATLIFLEELWPQAVGSDLSRRTRPALLQNGVLTVAVDDVSWARQLESLETALKTKVNEFWGQTVIERIRFDVCLDDEDERGREGVQEGIDDRRGQD